MSYRRTLLLICCAASAPLVAGADVPSYEQAISPILRTYCVGCHNDHDMEGELSVETFTSLRRGGAGSGDPIVPGDPAASVMIQRIVSSDTDHMPPADLPQVPPLELAMLKQWIAAAAVPPKRDLSILQSLVVPQLPGYAGAKPVTAADFSADGTRLAVARGREVTLMDSIPSADAATNVPGSLARPLAKPLVLADLPGTCNAIHWTSDSTRVVLAGGIAGLTGVAEIRDAVTGRLVRAFAGHRDVLYDAELSPDETLLATAGYDRSIKVWNVADGRLLRSIDVHNGAIFDLAWHPTGKVLASASADETVKLWRASDGVRLDTLNQPQAELSSVLFTHDGTHVIAAGRDKRIHLWRMASLDSAGLNPPVHSRFAHESPIVAIALSADGRHLFSTADDRSLSCWSVPDLVLEHAYPKQSDVASVLVGTRDGRFLVARMDGSIDTIAVRVDPASSGEPRPRVAAAGASVATTPAVGESPALAVLEREPNDSPKQAFPVALPATIEGTLGRTGDVDLCRFTATQGQPLLLEVNAARSKSKLDSRIEVLDARGRPVERVVLQATRDSWFTFRGKSSEEADDFRLHNWMEMELNEYLYANGEVVRLWLYPRGPDSGFKVYSGSGKRQSYFGTSGLTHALGEPAWIVQPLPPGSEPAANGLPVFRLFYENDDESTQRLGADSQLLFTAPADGEYLVRLCDVRGFGSDSQPDDYRYTLAIRPPQPSFEVTIVGKDPKVSPGSGREIIFKAVRHEGFEGPIGIAVEGLPAGFTVPGPIEIEAGQEQAIAVLMASQDAIAPDEAADMAVRVTATAGIAAFQTESKAGEEPVRKTVQNLGTLGDIALADKPKLTVEILSGESPVFLIRPGQTIPAKVRATRHDFTGRIELGGDVCGRNLPHGLFVDNIGLNGLMIVEGQTEREFVITAAPTAQPGRRLFHLRATNDGGQASVPVVIEVLK